MVQMCNVCISNGLPMHRNFILKLFKWDCQMTPFSWLNTPPSPNGNHPVSSPICPMGSNRYVGAWCICYLNFSLFTGSAGNKLATSIVEDDHCGAIYGGYLQGGSASEPAIAGSVVNATVCFYQSSSNPCGWPSEIKTRHCPGFLLYYLPQVSYCQLKYCGQQ